MNTAVPPSVMSLPAAMLISGSGGGGGGGGAGSLSSHCPRASRVRVTRSQRLSMNWLSLARDCSTVIGVSPVSVPKAASTRFHRNTCADPEWPSRQPVTSDTVTASDGKLGTHTAGAASSSSRTATVAAPAVADTV